MTKTEPFPSDVPPEFVAIFRELVIATQPRGLERDTCRVYYDTLREFSLTVLRASAEELRRQSKFFPTTAEWFQAAEASRREFGIMDCPKCKDYGLIRVNYASGEPFDLAVCDCRAGQWYRKTGEAIVRKTDAGAEARHIGNVEDFEDGP